MKPVFLTSHARLQALDIEVWWVGNRDKAPLLFTDELEAAFELLSVAPKAGRLWPDASEPGIRRYMLKTTHYHLYYREEEDHVRVLAVWGGPRGLGPDLGRSPF